MTSIIPTSPWVRFVAGSLASAGFATYIWKRRVQVLDYDDSWIHFLAEAPLRSTKDSNKKPFKAGALWDEKPVLILALRKPWCPNRHDAAAKVSALVKPELDKRGIALYAVTGDTWLVSGLHRNMKGDVFLDMEQRFFRPRQRTIYGKNNDSEEENDKLFDGIFLVRSGNIIHNQQVEELRGDMNINDIIRVISKLK
uniref:Uncharacterized protein n=1 Tax=Strigamia maritima TaxID=126957 RepID=T1ITF5_STRMM